MLTILMGTDWTANTDAVLHMIAEDVAAGKGGRVLMVPELISHDIERRLCMAAGDTCSRYAEVLSFTRLARRVSESVGHAAQECLDNGGRVVAMASAARQMHSKLKAYAAVETRPEFLTGLVDAVDEFKRCCITAQDLRQASAQTQGSLAQKLEELSLLLEAYDSLCQRGKRDPRDQMTWLLEQLEEGTFGQDHVFYIDGFPDFTRQHMAILEHLIRVSPSVTVSMNCDSPDSGAMAFEKAGATASELIRSARRMGVEVQILHVEPSKTSLDPVRQLLFQGKTEPKPQLADALKLYRTDSVYREATAAAEQIMELVRNGARYRDVGVVCTDMGQYRNAIQMVFHRCGIPVYLSGTEEILERPVVVTVLSAMEAALSGFEQREVFRYLKSVLSPVEPDLCDRVENYAILWNIHGMRWQREWDGHPRGLGEEWTEADRQALAELNRARHLAVDPLMRLRKGFADAKDLRQQVQVLYAFLEEIRLAERLQALAREMDAAGDNRSAQILGQLWEILLTALEQMHDVLGETVWDAETFTRLFKLLLSQYDVGTIPPVLDAVTAGPVSAMRCQRTKHLFVLGALEGSLPSYGGSAGVLTDQERVALRELGVPLTGGALDGLQAEFSEIYGVFCGASKTVCVSCPGGQPSFIYRRLCDLAGGEREVGDTLGAVLADPAEAGAFLARWNAEEAAANLGLGDACTDACHRRGYTLGQIGKENIQKLYGSCLHLSASQVDRQAECRMSYFLKYGLRAKERKPITIDPAEFGTYVHAVLEQTGRAVMERGGFKNVTLDKTLEIATKYSEQYARERFSQIDSSRMSYFFRRNSEELKLVVRELWQEMQQSDFAPVDFEVAFGAEGGLPAIEISGKQMHALLRGFVDRVDAWQAHGQNYFRVVDYKTGKKDFDYCDVQNGLGLQMLLYLFALEQEGQTLLGEHPVPAGVQYFPARVPLVSADGLLSDADAEQAREKLWKRKGLLLEDADVLYAMEQTEDPKRLCCTRKRDGSLSGDLADRQQLRLLKAYVFALLGNMVDDIASGNVAPNPYTRGSSHNACTFCPYGAVCHQATVEGRRNYKAISAREFWARMEGERNDG